MRAACQAYQETREIELPAPNLRIGDVGTTGGRFAGFKKSTAMQVFSKLWVCDGWIVSLTPSDSWLFLLLVSWVENTSYEI